MFTAVKVAMSETAAQISFGISVVTSSFLTISSYEGLFRFYFEFNRPRQTIYIVD